MSSVTVEMTGAFNSRTDLSAPVSESMRDLISSEAERWRQMHENSQKSASKSIFGRLLHGLSFLLRRR